MDLLPAGWVRSIKAAGNPRVRRKVASLRAISPLSRSWSKPAKCRIPCNAKILISWAEECPSRTPFCTAMSAEMAISPTRQALLGGRSTGRVKGNDSTSVALFLLRNWRFSERIAALLVTRTFTVPRNPAARRARSTKRSSALSLRAALRYRFVIRFLGGKTWQLASVRSA